MLSRYFVPVEMRLGTGSRGKDASKRNIGGAVGSAAYLGGESEDLADADVLNVRDMPLAVLWDFQVRKHKRDGERRYPAFHTQCTEGAMSATSLIPPSNW